MFCMETVLVLTGNRIHDYIFCWNSICVSNMCVKSLCWLSKDILCILSHNQHFFLKDKEMNSFFVFDQSEKTQQSNELRLIYSSQSIIQWQPSSH